MTTTVAESLIAAPGAVRKGVPFALAASGPAAVAVAAVLMPGFGVRGSTGAQTLSCLAVAVCALTAGVLLLWRYFQDRRADFRLLLAVGCLGWSASEFLNTVVGGHDTLVPRGQLIDVGYMLLAALAVVATVRHTRALDRLTRFVFWSDALMLTTSLTFVVWETVIEPGIAELSAFSAVDQIFITSYPIVDMVAVAALLLLLLIDVSPARLLTTIALAFMMVGDAVSSAAVGRESVLHEQVATVAFVCAFVLLAASAGVRRGASMGYERPTISRLVVVHFPGFVAYGIAIVKYFVLEREIRTLTTTILCVLWGLFIALNHYASWRLSATLSDGLSANLQRVHATEAELRALLDDLPDAVVVLNARGLILEANQRASDLTGLSIVDLRARGLTDLVSVEQLRQSRARWKADPDGVRGIGPTDFEFVHPEGTARVLQLHSRLPVRDPERIVVAMRDVTEDRAQHRRLEVARERFRLAFHGAPTGMALSRSSDGYLLDVNDTLAQMLGYDRHELIGRTVESITHPDDWAANLAKLQSALADSSLDHYRVDKRYLRHDGSTMWARTSVACDAEPDGSWLVISHIEDITAERVSAARLEWAATHDELTRLPNRFHFLEQLDARLAHGQLGSVAVMFIDLDNFKVINDSLGHDVGDELLRGMSERLRNTLRETDLLSRFGGDEFIVALTELGTPTTAIELADRLRLEIARPLQVGNAELFVTASIGIVFSVDGSFTADLLRDADGAMYRAKARGRDCVEVYAPGTHDSTVLKLRTTNEFRHGLERGEIIPYFQPIVRLDTGVLEGVEALARWRHPSRGLVTPDQFLPLAEETGLIGELGAVMLRSSLAQLASWRERLPALAHLTLSVNVSVRQLMGGDFASLVAETLAMTGLPADVLNLEITETTLMTDTKTAGQVLRQLRSLGVHLAVDDFGTGYSSLTYLKRFPVETIKIDRSFVSGLGIDAEDTSIVDAVIKLGHSLGLEVVAEGVETPLQLTRLRDLGCEYGQGYLFGRPQPVEHLELEFEDA